MTVDSVTLYSKLLESCGDIKDYTKNVDTFTSEFSSQFEFQQLNNDCFKEMYIKKQSKPIKRQDFFPKIKNLESTCKSCWGFYLDKRNESIKGLDIQFGKKFQIKILEFLNQLGFKCKKADDKKIYPDNVVLDPNGKIVAYLEIKYQSAPWLMAFRDKAGTKECYESSPALDIKKLEQQWQLVKTGEIKQPIYYVYWLDFPCVKGIYFVSINEIYKEYESKSDVFERKAREGDVSNNGEVVKSGLRKVHISIYKMHQFSELIDILSGG
jgi:hypothetical protein